MEECWWYKCNVADSFQQLVVFNLDICVCGYSMFVALAVQWWNWKCLSLFPVSSQVINQMSSSTFTPFLLLFLTKRGKRLRQILGRI